MAADRHQIESFLYYEARLMDEHQYDEWLSLWTDDAVYWVPSNRDNIDPMRELSIIYVDRQGLEDRIDQLKSGERWAQEPQSRMRRLISNVEFEEDGNGEVTVYSNFNLTELRRGRQETLTGRSIHKLRPGGNSFKIAFKKVLLVANDEFLHNVTYLL